MKPGADVKIPEYLERDWKKRKLPAEKKARLRKRYREKQVEHRAALRRGDSGFTFDGEYQPFFEMDFRGFSYDLPVPPKKSRKKSPPKEKRIQAQLFTAEELGKH
jgi:hypothetical protein